VQVGTSLCNFLTLNATLTHQPASGRHAAEVLLLFGSPAHLGTTGGDGCMPTSDVEAAAVHGAQFDWPELAGVEVLGWHLPTAAAAVEVVLCTDSCGKLQVVERLALPANALAARPAGLSLDLSALHHRLECPYGLRISFEASEGADGGAMAAS